MAGHQVDKVLDIVVKFPSLKLISQTPICHSIFTLLMEGGIIFFPRRSFSRLV